jgi:uncharacterized membrane protein
MKISFGIGVFCLFFGFYLVKTVPVSISGYSDGSLVYNLFLGLLPLVLSCVFKLFPKPLNLCILPFWLILLPNSFYILTDIGHVLDIYTIDYELKRQYLVFNLSNIPYLFTFEGLKFTTIAASSWAFGICSMLMVIETLILQDKQKKYIGILIGFLSGLGVALGRFYRWNSWDLFHSMEKIHDDSISVFTTKTGLLTILVFTVLIYFSFESLRKKSV